MNGTYNEMKMQNFQGGVTAGRYWLYWLKIFLIFEAAKVNLFFKILSPSGEKKVLVIFSVENYGSGLQIKPEEDIQ